MKAIGSYVVLREVPLGKAAFSRTASGAVGEAIYPALTLWAMDRLTGMTVLLHPVTATTQLPELPEHEQILRYSGQIEQGGYHFFITELPPNATPARDPILATMGALSVYATLHEAGVFHGNMHAAHLWQRDDQVVVAGAGLHWNSHALSPSRDLHELVLTLEQLGYVPTPLSPLLYGSESYSARQLLTLMLSYQAFVAAPLADRHSQPSAAHKAELTHKAEESTPPPLDLELPADMPPVDHDPARTAPPIRPIEKRPQPKQSIQLQQSGPSQVAAESTTHTVELPSDVVQPSQLDNLAKPTEDNLAANDFSDLSKEDFAGEVADQPDSLAQTTVSSDEDLGANLRKEILATAFVADQSEALSGGRPAHMSERNPISMRSAGSGLASQGLFLQRIALEQILVTPRPKSKKSKAIPNPASSTAASQVQQSNHDNSSQPTPASISNKPNPVLPKLVDWDEVEDKGLSELSPEELQPLTHHPFAPQTSKRAQTVFAVKVQAPSSEQPVADHAVEPTLTPKVNASFPSKSPTISPPSKPPQPQPKQSLPQLSYENFMPKQASNPDLLPPTPHPALEEDDFELDDLDDVGVAGTNPNQIPPVLQNQSQPVQPVTQDSKEGFFRGLLRPLRSSLGISFGAFSFGRRSFSREKKEEVASSSMHLEHPQKHDEDFPPRQPPEMGRHAPQMPLRTSRLVTSANEDETSGLALQRLRSDVTRLRDQAAAKRDKLADNLAKLDVDSDSASMPEAAGATESSAIDLSFTEDDFERWSEKKGSEVDQWQTPQQRRQQERQILQSASQLENELVARVIEAKDDAIHFNWPQVERLPIGLRSAQRDTSRRLGSGGHELANLSATAQAAAVMPLDAVLDTQETQQVAVTETQPLQDSQQSVGVASAANAVSQSQADYLGVQVQPQTFEESSAQQSVSGSGTSSNVATPRATSQAAAHARTYAPETASATATQLTSSQLPFPQSQPSHASWSSATYRDPRDASSLGSPSWVWPTLGLLLLVSANGWAWYYFVGNKSGSAGSKAPDSAVSATTAAPATTGQSSQPPQVSSAASDATTTNANNSANSATSQLQTQPTQATSATDTANTTTSTVNTNGSSSPSSGFVSKEECCEVAFGLPTNAPSSLIFTLTILQAPAEAQLEVGHPIGSAPGKGKFPLAGNYQIKASAIGYSDQVLEISAPYGKVVSVPVKPQQQSTGQTSQSIQQPTQQP